MRTHFAEALTGYSLWTPPSVDVSIFSMPGMKVGPSPYTTYAPGDSRMAFLFQAETRDAHTARHSMIQHEHTIDRAEYGQMLDPEDAFRSMVRAKLIEIATHEIDEVLLFNGKRYKDPHPEKPEYAAGNDPSPSKVKMLLRKAGITDRDYFPESAYGGNEREIFDCLGGRRLR
jgi:hypothetical protein